MQPKLFRLILLGTIFLSILSFAPRSNNSTTARNIQQNLAKVSDALYVNKYEVSNQEFNQFLTYIKQNESSLYSSYAIDTAGWSTMSSYSEPMSNYYHKHPAYSNYPVVNISYESAVAYCQWLSNQYNADTKRKFKKVRFFLPSEEEWMNVAGEGDKNRLYPWKSYYLRDKTGMFLCNFKILGDQSISFDPVTNTYKVMPSLIEGGMNDRAVYTSPVDAYAPGPFGIHNFSGNVAEMVAQNGVAKGGSFHSPGYDVRIQSALHYKKSSPEVGFRPFMRVIEP